MTTEVKMNHEIRKEIFRAYDIRGIVDKTLREQDIYDLGRALGTFLRRNGLDTLLHGRDGRLSADRFSELLQKGLVETGCHVVNIGQVPTPMLYYATRKLNILEGVMLTASHNPADYNGLKIVFRGLPLSSEDIQVLYKMVLERDFITGQGSISHQSITELYAQDIVDRVHLKKPLKIVIDCANGISGRYATSIFERLGCKVSALYCEVDGNFPNHEPDPSEIHNLDALIDKVKSEKADIGLAFDGDADRVFVIDDQGNIVFPDRMMMLMIEYILKEFPQGKIVFDVKSTRNLKTVIEQHGGQAILCRTGHSFLKHKMKELDSVFGGEASGHIIYRDWYGFDDGLYIGAKILEILSQETQPLSFVMQRFPKGVITPEFKVFVGEDHKESMFNELAKIADFGNADIITIDGLRVEYPYGWGLVRVSNTSPYFTLRFEAEDESKLNGIKHVFREQLVKLKPDLEIPF